MSAKKNTAGSATSTAAEKENLSHSIIPFDDEKVKEEAVKKLTEPDKPYYTVEVSNEGQIRQCYGYKNNLSGNPKPPEIQAFEKQYQHYLTEVFNEKRTQCKLQQSA